MAVRDAEGCITMIDRMKDMINTDGETVVAVVQTADGADITLAELREFGASYISDYKLPRVTVLLDIPATLRERSSSKSCARKHWPNCIGLNSIH